MLHEVTLKSMAFHTRIGTLPHEAEIAQSIEVDLARRDFTATVMSKAFLLFLLGGLIMIFARFLPMIAISEVKGVLATQKHLFKNQEVVTK